MNRNRTRNPTRIYHLATTPDALIAAGRRLFARHGYDGASVRAITAEAGANLGALTYHFGGKRAFYEAVVASCVDPLAQRIAGVAGGSGDPLERAGAVVRAFFEHLWANPELPFLMMQELAAGRSPPPAATAAMRRVLSAVRGLIEEGQRAGRIRPGDPLLLGLSIISQPVHLTLARRIAKLVGGLDQDRPEVRARLLSHASGFVQRALAAEGEEVESGTGAEGGS